MSFPWHRSLTSANIPPRSSCAGPAGGRRERCWPPGLPHHLAPPPCQETDREQGSPARIGCAWHPHWQRGFANFSHSVCGLLLEGSTPRQPRTGEGAPGPSLGTCLPPVAQSLLVIIITSTNSHWVRILCQALFSTLCVSLHVVFTTALQGGHLNPVYRLKWIKGED